MNETQLELDFVEWLGALSSAVEWKYMRWFEDDKGGVGEDFFCEDCAEIEARRRKKAGKKKEPYWEMRGWNDSGEEDSQPSCAKCGTALHCSPTSYMIEEEIRWLETTDEMDEASAASFHNWLTGMGNYDRETDWPKIRPHAIRLMKKAGVQIVKPGMVRFRPSDVFEKSWYNFDSIWLSIYEYYARKLLKFAKGRNCLHFLNNTSGVNYDSFTPLCDTHAPHRNLLDLFENVGKGNGRAEFLDAIGLKSMADLDKPILIRDQRCDWPRFDVRGLKLKEPGPNSCHPQALTVMCASLQFSRWDLRWNYSLTYGYTHYDSSSWSISIKQAGKQGLPEFMAAVARWCDEVLEPIDRYEDQYRESRLRNWDQARKALEVVFYPDPRFGPDGEDADQLVQLADEMVKLKHGSMQDCRITLGGDRLETLRQWIKEDEAKMRAKKQAAEIAKR